MRPLRSVFMVAALVAAALVVSACVATTSAAAAPGRHVPKTPIRHLVVVMQEGHSFDNYFGTYPGADGFSKRSHLHVDPLHGGSRFVRPFEIDDQSTRELESDALAATTALDDGSMDGFVEAQASGNAKLTMGHYGPGDVSYYWNMADRYVLFDHFFSSVLGGSYLNRIYSVAGSAGDALDGAGKVLRVTTIFDRLQAAGVSWRFYVEGYNVALTSRSGGALTRATAPALLMRCPLLDIPRFLDDPRLSSHIVDLSRYYEDLASGNLPKVAYVVTSASSEAAPRSIAAGQRAVRGLVNALMESGAWGSSALMLTYADWGGWYDHVRPPRRDANGDGFRVPTLLVSPYSRSHFVDHVTLDFTSILKFIEQNWGIRPLGRLDATAGSLMTAFDFHAAPTKAEIIPWGRVAPRVPSPLRDSLLYSLYAWSALLALVLLFEATVPVRRRVLRLHRADGMTTSNVRGAGRRPSVLNVNREAMAAWGKPRQEGPARQSARRPAEGRREDRH